MSTVEKVMRIKSPVSFSFGYTGGTAKIVWLKHVCRPVLGEEGEFLGTRVNNRDITERKQAESERKITVQLLSQSSAAGDLDELLRGITSVLQRWSGVAAVGIRLRDHEDYPYYETHGFGSSSCWPKTACARRMRKGTLCGMLAAIRF